MIGSLLYLTVYKPNIMFNVYLCVRFQQEPREVHLIVVKRVFRYLIGTLNLGLLFKRREDIRLTSFCDADYVGENVKRKSTSGNFVTWICKKQGSTMLSTTET